MAFKDDFERLKKRYWLALLVLGALVVILGFLVEFFSEGEKGWVRQNLLWFVVFSLTHGLLAIVAAWFHDRKTSLERDLRTLTGAGSGDQSNLKRHFLRFDRIKKIRLGHLSYPPLLHYGGLTGNDPLGPGLRVLQEVFTGCNVSMATFRSRWDSIIEDLEARRFEILATPVFETRPRAVKVSFSRPLFFSEVGAFIRAGDEHFSDLIPQPGNRVNWADLVHFIRDKINDLVFTVIRGEISEQIVSRDLRPPASRMTVKDEASASVASLITSLARKDLSDIVFAECLQADQCPEVRKGEVLNILQPGQLLYPVCYALPQVENVLRAYLNLKLAEIDETRPGGIVGLLLEELHDIPAGERREFAKRYFVPYQGFSWSQASQPGFATEGGRSVPDTERKDRA